MLPSGIRLALSGGIIFHMLFIFGCQKENVTPEVNLLTSVAWGSPVVLVDGVDQSTVYKDFKITFGKDSYVSTGGSPIWKSSGVWEYTDEAKTIFLLDNQTEVKINQLSTDRLELELQWSTTTYKGGRANSVSGKNIFQLKKL